MIEDEATRLRRNLVTASSIVIVVWFLDVDFVAYAGKALAVTDGLSRVRVWLSVGVLLLYLALRYRFSEEHSEVSTALLTDYKLKVTDATQERVRRGIVEEPNSAMWALPDGTAFSRKVIQNMNIGVLHPHPPPSQTVDFMSSHLLEGSVQVTEYGMAIDSPPKYYEEIYSLDYCIKGRQAALIKAICHFQAYFYSKPSIEFAAPALLASIAFGIVCYEVVVSGR